MIALKDNIFDRKIIVRIKNNKGPFVPESSQLLLALRGRLSPQAALFRQPHRAPQIAVIRRRARKRWRILKLPWGR
jgi:hypothetical protein